MHSDSDDSTVFRDPASFLPPTCEVLNEKIPAFEFIEFVDRGGMGAVYKARQKSLNRIVAVKLLPPANMNRQGFADRFRREAEALARLSHPNIVAVHDSGETEEGFLYYSMEFVEGPGDLARLMRAGGLSDTQRLKIVTQVCDALQYAHERNVVHRDIKPSNILIDQRGNAKVADFGLAKILAGKTAATGTLSGPMGTPEYVAPEALDGDVEVDHRADIYSLGVVLYELLTGHVPKGIWEPPSKCGADKRLDGVVTRALQPDPRKRYQRAGEMTAVLQQLLRPASTVGAGNSGPARRSRVSRVALVVVPVVLGSASIALWLNPDWRSRLAVFPAEPFDVTSATMVAEPPTPRELQLSLARWVWKHGGFVNIKTEFRNEHLMGEQHDIRSEGELPKGDFTIWRVSFSENADFDDEDMFGLISAAEGLHTVENLNLYGTHVTPLGLGQIIRLSDTLTGLGLRNTTAFSAASIPFITNCPKLRHLHISEPDGPGSGMSELISQIQQKLPDCQVESQ